MSCSVRKTRPRPIKIELGTLEAKLSSSGRVVVAYGGGTDSTAMLIELVRRRIRVDAILFADTGGERITSSSSSICSHHSARFRSSLEFVDDLGRRLAIDTTWGMVQPAEKYRKDGGLDYVVEYSAEQAWTLWKKHNMPGPWDPAIKIVTDGKEKNHGKK